MDRETFERIRNLLAAARILQEQSSTAWRRGDRAAAARLKKEAHAYAARAAALAQGRACGVCEGEGVVYPHRRRCPACGGSGAIRGRECCACEGEGWIQDRLRPEACPACHGRGY